MRNVLVPIANGSESLETVAIVNVLRRAGIAVTLASIEPTLTICGTRELKLTADALLGDVASRDWDAIVLPGGLPGAEALGRDRALIERLRRQRDGGKLYAAICAAPAVALGRNGLLDGRRATGYPGIDGIPQRVDENVVVDGNCVTSAGPGTAIAFGLKLVELLVDGAKSRDVARAMLVAR
jgi:4-methyl-5(b-hydroxyethyl)-thiazole monophosphate biosynthesis